eukprot:GHVS01079878.1.p1 GENE.GHVS01079878.1~~GHVS01079878.1.p1  ORF type:complete len:894 (-),score=190.43 GHVS01079878.1:390-3071(-)
MDWEPSQDSGGGELSGGGGGHPTTEKEGTQLLSWSSEHRAQPTAWEPPAKYRKWLTQRLRNCAELTLECSLDIDRLGPRRAAVATAKEAFPNHVGNKVQRLRRAVTSTVSPHIPPSTFSDRSAFVSDIGGANSEVEEERGLEDGREDVGGKSAVEQHGLPDLGENVMQVDGTSPTTSADDEQTLSVNYDSRRLPFTETPNFIASLSNCSLSTTAGSSPPLLPLYEHNITKLWRAYKLYKLNRHNQHATPLTSGLFPYDNNAKKTNSFPAYFRSPSSCSSFTGSYRIVRPPRRPVPSRFSSNRGRARHPKLRFHRSPSEDETDPPSPIEYAQDPPYGAMDVGDPSVPQNLVCTDSSSDDSSGSESKPDCSRHAELGEARRWGTSAQEKEESCADDVIRAKMLELRNLLYRRQQFEDAVASVHGVLPASSLLSLYPANEDDSSHQLLSGEPLAVADALSELTASFPHLSSNPPSLSTTPPQPSPTNALPRRAQREVAAASREARLEAREAKSESLEGEQTSQPRPPEGDLREPDNFTLKRCRKFFLSEPGLVLRSTRQDYSGPLKRGRGRPRLFVPGTTSSKRVLVTELTDPTSRYYVGTIDAETGIPTLCMRPSNFAKVGLRGDVGANGDEQPEEARMNRSESMEDDSQWSGLTERGAAPVAQGGAGSDEEEDGSEDDDEEGEEGEQRAETEEVDEEEAPPNDTELGSSTTVSTREGLDSNDPLAADVREEIVRTGSNPPEASDGGGVAEGRNGSRRDDSSDTSTAASTTTATDSSAKGVPPSASGVANLLAAKSEPPLHSQGNGWAATSGTTDIGGAGTTPFKEELGTCHHLADLKEEKGLLREDGSERLEKKRRILCDATGIGCTRSRRQKAGNRMAAVMFAARSRRGGVEE